MKNKIVGVLATALIAIVFLGWFATRPKPRPPVAAPTEVTVAQVGEFFIYLPLYYAQDRGYFSRNGLKVKFVSSGGDDKSVAAVIAGAADFGVGDPTFAAVAKEQGRDIRVVASVVNGVPFWGVTKRTDLKPITNPAQLRGLTVATFPKPSTAYVLQEAMFREGGLKPSIREAQFGSLLPLLDTRAVDIVLELEPNVSTVVANGGHVLYSMASKYPDFAITGVTTSAGTIASRPDVVRRFVVALNEAEMAGHANPNDLVAYAQSHFPNVPGPVAAAAVKRMLGANVYPATSAVSASGWRQAINLRVNSGDLKSPAAGVGVVDNQFSH
jgi:NitT/TauT family transport system substrate-binding protein